MSTLFQEPYVAVVPSDHRLASSEGISADTLRNEPFVFFAESAGPRVYAKTMALFGESGVRPKVVQEGSQWLTLLRLVGVGMGVTVALACVAKIAGVDVVCRPIVGTTLESEIELGYRADEDREIVAAFWWMARRELRQPAGQGRI